MCFRLSIVPVICLLLLLLLLSRVGHVRLCATPQTAAHQAPPSLGFSRQEHWSGLPFPSPIRESESEVSQSCPTLSDPMDCSLPRSSIHGIFQARVLEWGAIAFSQLFVYLTVIVLSILITLTQKQNIAILQGNNNGKILIMGVIFLQKQDRQYPHISIFKDSVQFSSVIQTCLTLCDPVEGSTSGLRVHHQLPELAQTQGHQAGDAIQPSHHLLCPFPPASVVYMRIFFQTGKFMNTFICSRNVLFHSIIFQHGTIHGNHQNQIYLSFL